MAGKSKGKPEQKEFLEAVLHFVGSIFIVFRNKRVYNLFSTHVAD
jgi:hypothetical protein